MATQIPRSVGGGASPNPPPGDAVPNKAPIATPQPTANDILNRVKPLDLSNKTTNPVIESPDQYQFRQPEQVSTNITNPRGLGYIAEDEQGEPTPQSQTKSYYSADRDASTYDPDKMLAKANTQQEVDAIRNADYQTQLKQADTQARERTEKKSEETKAQGSIQEEQENPEQPTEPTPNTSQPAQGATSSPADTTAPKQTLAGKVGSSIQSAASNAINNTQAGQTIQKTKEAVEKAKKIAQAAQKARGLFALGSSAPVWLYVVVVLIISAIVFGLFSAILQAQKQERGRGGGADRFFYTGLSSPESCSRSAIEAGYGIAAELSTQTLTRDILAKNTDGTVGYEGQQALNSYAKYAAIVAQATTNLIRYGSAVDRKIDNPLEEQNNPYNSGVVIDQNLANLIESQLNLPIDQGKSDTEAAKPPLRNLLNYDADVASAKIEGAGVSIQPDAVTTLAPTVSIRYFDTSSPTQTTDNRKIQGGPISLRDENNQPLLPATITRKSELSESFGVTTADFLTPQSKPREPYKAPFKIDTDSPETDTGHYQKPYKDVPDGTGEWPVGILNRDYLTQAEIDKLATVAPDSPDITADARLTDGSLVSFNSLTVGANIKVLFGVRIPIVSDIIEAIINGILNAILKFDLIKNPVLSTGYYRAANIGSFASTLLNKYDATKTNPFESYTGHVAINDRNDATKAIYDSYLSDPIKNSSGLTPPSGIGAENATGVDGISTDGTTADNPQGNAEQAVQNNPVIKSMREAQAQATKSLTTASSPELTKIWQAKTGAESLQTAMSNITDLFLTAGNQTRTVSGVNIKVIINISINITPVPPFVLVYPTWPSISGLFAKKNISNAPSGREYLDLYNRVGIAVMKASADPATWPTDPQYGFNTGALADGDGIAKGMESWIGECKAQRYDVTNTGNGISSAFTQADGLNSCKLYERNASVYDDYLTKDPTKYITQEEKDRLKTLGIDSRRSYYESIIAAEAKAQGIDPTDGVEDEIDRTKLAYILATAAYETNADFNPTKRAFQEADFVRFSEINPVYFNPLSNLVGSVGKDNVGKILQDTLIAPFEDRIKSIQAGVPSSNTAGNGTDNQNSTDTFSISSRDSDIFILTLNTIAGLNETYGPLGKGVSDAAQGAVNSIILGNISGVLGSLGVDAQVDLQSIMKKWYKATETGNPFSGVFDDDTVGYVFDPNANGSMFYGRGFAPSTIRGKGVYKKLQELLGKPFTFDPNQIRDNPSAMAQTLIAGMKAGTFTGYKIDDFFAQYKADPVNARAIINPNFVFTKTGITPTDNILTTRENPLAAAGSPEDPNRNVEQTIPDKFLLERYRYYYEKIRTIPESFYTAAKTACNATPDGKIFKNNTTANACLKEGFNVLNTSDEKNKYQSYGVTLSANAGTPIYPVYGGEVLYSNFATKTPAATASSSSSSSSQVDETALKQRRNKTDPISGNQISVVSNVDGTLYVTRYTNLDGTKLPSVSLAPGTPINKDDIVGFVGNSGPERNGKLPETQLRIEIARYYGNGLESKTEDIFSSVRDFGQLQNPLYHIKTQATSQDEDAIRLCNEDIKNTLNYSGYALTPPKGITVPGVNVPFDTWLLLK